jgi:gliding motility-associated-like protein
MMPGNCLADPFSQFTNSSRIADASESGFSYSWNFGDPNANGSNPNTSNLKDPQHKYAAVGPYNVTLSVISKDGCVADTTQVFFVNGSLPQSGFSVQGGVENCSNNPVSIKNNSSVDVGRIVKLEVFWDATDPSNRITDNDPQPGEIYAITYPEFFTPSTKNYTLRVRAYSGDLCFEDTSVTIILNASPQLQFDPISSICSDVAPLQLKAGALNNSSITGNGLFTGKGVSSTGQFNPATAGAGIHTIRYTFTTDKGCINFTEEKVEVYKVPVANAGPDRVVLKDGMVTLTGSATGTNLSYLWTPSYKLNNITTLTPAASPDDDFTYNLTVTSTEGCSDADQVFVKVLKAPAIPNVFSPNGDGIHDKWQIDYLDSYPGATVEIYNRYGQLVFQSKGYSKPWDGTYNGKQVPVGTYYYIINPKNGRKQISGFVDIIR